MRWEALAGMMLVIGSASRVHAGNDDSFFQGNEAAMMGGAVTAVGSGPGQLWYNPAGLGLNTRNKLELSGSLFTLRVRHTDPFLEIAAYDPATDEYAVIAKRSERNIEMLSVPSALSYTRRIGDHVTAGFGIFMQLQDAAESDRTVSAMIPDLDVAYRYSLSYSQQRLFAGPGLGAQFGRARFGASLFIVYDRLRIRETSSILGTIAGLDAIATEDYRLDLRRIAVELVLGAQFQLTDHFVAGITVRGPRFKINDRYDESIQATEAVGDGTAQAFGVFSARGRGNISSESNALAAPIETVVSMGYRSDSLRIGFDFDLAHPLTSLFDYAWTWNVRAGIMAVVSDSLELGGGLFTDRASIFGSGGFDLFVDYYGASLAATLSTPVGLRNDEGGPDKLIFRTTVALRYAVGVGLAAGSFTDITSIDADPEDTPAFGFGEDQYVVFHEVALYIGSGLDF